MTGRQAVERQLRKLTKAIKLLRAEGLPLAALMLFYATIDSRAWLQRENPDGKSTRRDFRTWVDSYLLPALDERARVFTSEELYGARCALLHSQTAESTLSQQPGVREIHYRRRDFAFKPNDTPPRPAVTVDLVQLMNALEPATARFFSVVDGDNRLAEQVEQQAKKWWVELMVIPGTERHT